MMEYTVLKVVKNLSRYTANNTGIYLRKKKVIDRINVMQYLELARELLSPVIGTRSTNDLVVIMDDFRLSDNVSRMVRDNRNPSVVYVISRTSYSQPLPRTEVDLVENLGYQYRGVWVYQIADSIVRYPIYYFSRKVVRRVLPVILPSLPNNLFSSYGYSVSYDYAELSPEMNRMTASSYPISGGVITYTGTTLRDEPIQSQHVISIGNKEGLTHFFEVLLPDTIGLKPLPSSSGGPLSPTFVTYYHNPLSRTTIHIYSDTWDPRVRSESYSLVEGWYLTRVAGGETKWYAHTATSHHIPVSLWDILRNLQSGHEGELPVRLTTKRRALSVATLVRHWSQLRYSDERSYELEWDDEENPRVLQYNSGDVTSEAVVCPNEYGVLSLYSLPVKSKKASPLSLYPLPMMDTKEDTPIPVVRREERGQLVVYDDASPKFRVVGGEVQVHDPTGLMERRVDVEDGAYQGMVEIVEDRIKWMTTEIYTGDDMWSSEELVDYCLSVLSPITKVDLALVPSRRNFHILGDVEVAQDVSVAVSQRVVRVVANTVGVAAWNEFLGYNSSINVMPIAAPTRPFPLNVSTGDGRNLVLYTESPVEIEWEYSQIQTNGDALSPLSLLPGWETKVVPRRRLIARNELDPVVTGLYYVTVDGEEEESSITLEDKIVLYQRDSHYRLVARTDTATDEVLSNLRVILTTLLLRN
jgi:hypothetical protein